MNIGFIRKNIELVKQNQQNRFASVEIISEILELDNQWKELILKMDIMKSKKNIMSNNFRIIIDESADDKLYIDDLEKFIHNITNINIKQYKMKRATFDIIYSHITTLANNYEKNKLIIEAERNKLIHKVGNMLLPEANISENEDNNVIIDIVTNTDESITKNVIHKLSHIDLLTKFKLVDYDKGIKLAGNRGYFLTGFMVKFNQALIRYACDFLEKYDYKLMDTPQIIKSDIISKICQLEDYEDTLYKLDNQDKFLIATSEQPLTGYFSDTHYSDKSNLPIKFAGISSCFRKETGAHNRNTRGIFRVHQFTKVEQFCVTHKEESSAMFSSMMDLSRKFYDSLGISYRVINIASAALNNSAAVKYDLEAWFCGSKEYMELVSCTNTTDYFSNKINCTYQDGANKENVHMLNCTLCANTRTLCCLIEAYQTDTGFIIPIVLRPYLDNLEEYICE